MHRRSCASRRGVSRQPAQRRSRRSPGSPEQISDQLLSLLVVAKDLRANALDADQSFDRLDVVTLSSVRDRSFEMNLAPSPNETRSEIVGVDLIGDLHSSIGLVQAHGCSQRVRAHVGGPEAGPRVVAIPVKTLGEMLGVSEIPPRGRRITLSGCRDRGDQQEGAAHRYQRRVPVARRSQMIGSDGGNLFSVRPFANHSQAHMPAGRWPPPARPARRCRSPP